MKEKMKTMFENLDVRLLESKNHKECWINSSDNYEKTAKVIQNVIDYLNYNRFEIISLRLFGNLAALSRAYDYIEKDKSINCKPVSILQDDSIETFSLQVYCISAGKKKNLYFEDGFIGCEFEDEYATYYLLRILPDDDLKSPFDETQNIFEKSQIILSHLGCDFSSTIRTWLFADDILAWYGDLNKARNQFFTDHNIFNNLVPASTGIGVANFFGKSIAVQVLAMKSKNGKASAKAANSPLQCPALNYKSSFSRGLIVGTGEYKKLYISGTASIDKDGKTIFLNDTKKQLEFTMKVVKAILKDAGMDWINAVSSIAYFKYKEDFHLFDNYCRAENLKLPHIKLQADVCRDDLLFEIEMDAMSRI